MGKDVIGFIPSVSDDYGRVHGIGSVHHIAECTALIILMPALNNSVLRAKVIQGVQVLQAVGFLSARPRDKRCGIVRICRSVQVGAINSKESEALYRASHTQIALLDIRGPPCN